ncbi:MAG: bifunctional DNA-formamidopyrimidine glycosylase/DNA-(apurinic or apyrimidinic site) lyase [Acidimicrobiales bacterium]|nr:bifunctional DNA-formamidopyrimidine glycosylase/DNA-(apurinic or apyrimidinic site) lyase [Hyphomonadaceae bacterium]RZV42667.1 MAG: bifunctional DNA-formamidopyrimidine glycosylase/DNA-(apurinic or apyrimidinic site) lyase [Acidimicrobiales bacterium]
MPELPEVETVRAGLAPVMEGRKFTRVKLNREDLRFPFPKSFIRRLEGKSLISLRRRAKFLMGELSSGETLIMHLGMSGRFTIETGSWPADDTPTNPQHDHVIFTMQKLGSEKQGPTIIYNDPRRFGFMELLGQGESGRLKGLGPEPLSNHFSGPSLFESLTGKKAPIKSALLDQRIVAGLGNIYVLEALHASHISPIRLAKDVTQDEAALLTTEIKKTLELAIKAGGSTLNDFAAADGALGYFQHRFQVYGKEGTACPTPACTGNIERIKQSGRSSFYCPNCQI